MSDTTFIFVFLLAGVLLLAAELFLPTHGLLGVMGVVSIALAIGKTFWINQWAGVGLLLACAIASPFAWSAAIRIWPKTPFGRKVVLPPVVNVPEAPPVHLGQTGRTISELRPMGVCDFEGTRVEAIAEIGMIDAGQQVTVIAMQDRRPMVRAV